MDGRMDGGGEVDGRKGGRVGTSERQMVRLRRLQGKQFMSLKSCNCMAFEKSKVRSLRLLQLWCGVGVVWCGVVWCGVV